MLLKTSDSIIRSNRDAELLVKHDSVSLRERSYGQKGFLTDKEASLCGPFIFPLRVLHQQSLHFLSWPVGDCKAGFSLITWIGSIQ